MNELEEIKHLFKIDIKRLEQSVLTSLYSEEGVSLSDSIGYLGNTLVAAKVYKGEYDYSIMYLEIQQNGNPIIYKENEGILSTLFLNPEKECFVSIVVYHPDKEEAIEIPLFERENFVPAKPSKPILGDFISTYKQFSVFYDVDTWSDKKNDKIFFLEFKDRQVKKCHRKKVPFPNNNKIYVDETSDEIHLLAKDDNHLLLRIVNEKADIVKTREIAIKEKFGFIREVLSLSFDKDSYILTELESGRFNLLIVKPDGSYSLKLLVDIGSMVYNTWRPVKLDDNTFVVQFNTEFGNGWITIREDALLEVFYSNDNTGLYQDLLYGKNLNLGDKSLILSKINRTDNDAYSVLFYTRTEGKEINKSVLTLNRRIN